MHDSLGSDRSVEFEDLAGGAVSAEDDLIAAGELTPDEARTHPRRNIITRAVQPHQESPARATFRVLTDVRRGDLFLLCSDGVTEQLEDAALAEILLDDATLEQRMQTLVEECQRRETRDNHTGYLLEVVGGTRLTASDAVVATDATPSAVAAPCRCSCYGRRLYWWFLVGLLLILLLTVLLVMVGRQHNTPAETPHEVNLEPVQRTPR